MKLFILILLSLFSFPSKSQRCGQLTYNSGLIINGDDTTRGEFPFLIALWELPKDRFFCAANLISKRHALTGKTHSDYCLLITDLQIRSGTLHSWKKYRQTSSARRLCSSSRQIQSKTPL